MSVLVDGVAQPMMAHGVPLDAARSGFWAIVPFEPPPRSVEVAVRAELGGGREREAPIGTVKLEQLSAPTGAPSIPEAASRGPLVAICMATFDPPAGLLERQIESIRGQTHDNWICLISDDNSSSERFAAIEQAVGGDARFVVSRSERRAGFYRNFERALSLVPAAVDCVALADQDDRWHPNKLETLLSALGDARLAYSDARTIAPDGRVLAESLWKRRRNNRTNLPSLLLQNTVTGATALFRRDLLEAALPFPPAPGIPYHDHWIALVALATGELGYVDRPLLDYVQHRGAVIGAAALEASPALGRAQRLRRLVTDPAAALSRWQDAYFDEYCRTLLLARVLRMRCADQMSRAKLHGLDRFLASERSPRSLAWLAARPLRGVVGHNETRGFEHRLLRGIAWRHVARLISGHRP